MVWRGLLMFLVVSAAPSARVDAQGPTVTVRNSSELAAALKLLKAGTTLKIAPGEYSGNRYVVDIERFSVEALDPAAPPVFKGGALAWHFSRCAGLTVRNLRLTGQSVNGLNLDDGGRQDQPVTGITLEGLDISDVGPNGNHDGIKGSGLDRLTIRNCTIAGWGGQGIDLVGCHDSLIQGCRLIGKPGTTATCGIQLKGGSSDVVIEKCEFRDAGERALNVGGSTGAEFFRPRGAKYEAKDIVVRENVIEGSLCAAAFVGVDGAEFTNNTVLFPRKWLFRILQENNAPGLSRSRNVAVTENRIVFRRSAVSIDVNIGPNTAPETF